MQAVLRGSGWFLLAFALGLVVRVLLVLAFFPAFVVSDAPSYLRFSGGLSQNRPAGYDAFVWLLQRVSPSLALIAGVQHLIGLAAAVLLYVVLRRWGVRDAIAAMATLPLLLDGMELMLEHTPLSDALFTALMVAVVAVLAWRRHPSVCRVACAGSLLGVATLVRSVGEPAILALVVFCLLAATDWRSRAVTSAVVIASFMVPLAGYAVAYHAVHGVWGIDEAGGRSLYMRTTGFVQCSKLTGLPSYERTLCPDQPVGKRKDPTVYGWFSPDHTAGMHPPAGVSLDHAFRDFAERAIRAQPGAYAAIVLRDTGLTFSWRRADAYEYDTASKWQLASYASKGISSRARTTYLTYGGVLLHPRQPLADWFGRYGRHVYLPGVVMAVLALLAAFRALGRRTRENRPLIALTALLGVGLLLVPVVSLEVVWRYVLPGVALLPMAAAAAFPSRRQPVPEPAGITP